MRHIQVHLAGMSFRRWEDRVERSLSQHMSDEIGHGIFRFLLARRFGLFRSGEKLFFPEMEEGVDGCQTDEDLVDGECTRVG